MDLTKGLLVVLVILGLFTAVSVSNHATEAEPVAAETATAKGPCGPGEEIKVVRFDNKPYGLCAIALQEKPVEAKPTDAAAAAPAQPAQPKTNMTVPQPKED